MSNPDLSTGPPPDSDPPTGGWSFLRRPVWIVGHIVVIVSIVSFAVLGMWQFRRHEERQAIDERVIARLDERAVPVTELAPIIATNPASLEFRRVEAIGTYLTGDEVVWQARTRNGVSGHQVLTPLDLGNGTAVIVERGWVPIDATDPPVQGAEPPDGEVTVTGYLRLTQERGSLGPVDPATGRLARVSRVDVARLGDQIATPLQGMWLQLEDQEPVQPGGVPRPMPAPTPGDGPPHLSYAVQWFLFAGVVAVGYPILLRRTRRHPVGDDIGQGPALR